MKDGLAMAVETKDQEPIMDFPEDPTNVLTGNESAEEIAQLVQDGMGYTRVAEILDKTGKALMSPLQQKPEDKSEA